MRWANRQANNSPTKRLDEISPNGRLEISTNRRAPVRKGHRSVEALYIADAKFFAGS